MNTFIESNNFACAKVVFFATSGGSPIDLALNTFRNEYPYLTILKGVMLNGDVTGDLI